MMKENTVWGGKMFFEEAMKRCQEAEEYTSFQENNSGSNSQGKYNLMFEKLGEATSLIYRAATCYWGCNNGDHLIERLISKIANQSICAFKLYRSCYYDESLMITRGIGEITNLLYLFYEFPNTIDEWKTQTDKERMNNFGPSKVRKKLKGKINFAPIDDDRYSKLCEVGTHPNPNEIPSHYTGLEIGMLGIYQPVGSLVSIMELGHAIGHSIIVVPKLLNLKEELVIEMKLCGFQLIKSLPSLTILNYRQELREFQELNNNK